MTIKGKRTMQQLLFYGNCVCHCSYLQLKLYFIFPSVGKTYDIVFQKLRTLSLPVGSQEFLPQVFNFSVDEAFLDKICRKIWCAGVPWVTKVGQSVSISATPLQRRKNCILRIQTIYSKPNFYILILLFPMPTN